MWEVNKVEDNPRERAKRVKRYERMMKPVVDAQVLEARKQLVRKYRASPEVFPNGPDGRAWGCEAWYNPEEWTDEGEFIAVTKVEPVTKVDVTKVAEELVDAHMGRPPKGERVMSGAERNKAYRERLAAAREVLAKAEGKSSGKG